ncbi:MAG: ABC transporter permease subunit [Firmicutes bacterium]|nr:ABC transporter permease subunit [Bacillota bacterium]
MRRKNTKKTDAIIIAVLIIICAAIGFSVVRQNDSGDINTDEQSAVPQTGSEKQLRYTDYAGKRLGIKTGTLFDGMTQSHIPDAQISYFNTYTDLVGALLTDKIDGFAADEPVAKCMMAEDPRISYIKDYLEEYGFGYAFPKTDEGKEVCDKFSEYIQKLKSDGTLQEIDDIWFGTDKSKKVIPPLNELSAQNGVLKYAVESANEPFVFMQDGEIVGYDIDIAYRFCKEYGYGLELSDMNFGAIIPAVQSGKCDFGSSGMTINEERSKSVYFTEPNFEGGAILVVRAADIAGMDNGNESTAKTVKWQDYNGKKIGIMTGSSFEKPTFKNFPDSEYSYYNNYSDMNIALNQGLIDGYIGDEPTVKSICIEQPQIDFIDDKIQEDNYSFGFPKDTEKSKKLCGEFNDFLAKAKADGVIDELEAVWLGTDEDKKVVDLSEIENNPEKIKIVISSSLTPFTYIKDGKYVGYAMDLALRFGKEYGYSFDIEDVDPAAFIAGVTSGKYDMGVGSVSVTPERKESMLFSEPFYNGGMVLAVRNSDLAVKPSGSYENIEDMPLSELADKRLGVMTGSLYEKFLKERYPNAPLSYFNNQPDMAAALSSDKIDGFCVPELTAKSFAAADASLTYLKEPFTKLDYAFAFPKEPSSEKLCTELNEFLAEIRSSGEYDEMKEVWFGDDESKKNIDMSDLTGENGTIKFATTGTFEPFSYVKDGQTVGFEVDIAVRFCRKYGYGMDISLMDFGAIIPGLTSEKYDMSACNITITEERAQSIRFSDPDYTANAVVMVRKMAANTTNEAQEESVGFLSGLKQSFEKNFIREARWKLVVEGIATTLVITFFSTLFGTVLAFLICIFRRTESRLAILLSDIYVRILQGTPAVVLLMILYYIVFGKSGLNAVIVAIVGFSLNLAAYVSEMMRSGIESIDPGQIEAALALGFTEKQAFYKFIFPQAATRFLPVYRGEIVSLLKNTSIVGYIAVQDLTKMSDIIRSRTYEAFFPLIATALIYFALAWVITLILGKVEKMTDPKSKRQKIDK